MGMAQCLTSGGHLFSVSLDAKTPSISKAAWTHCSAMAKNTWRSSLDLASSAHRKHFFAYSRYSSAVPTIIPRAHPTWIFPNPHSGRKSKKAIGRSEQFQYETVQLSADQPASPVAATWRS
jgi:hypothetical protein